MMISLPPPPHGFTSRNATFADVELAAQKGMEYALATTGFSDIDAETLRSEWQSPGFDPSRDVYLVFSPQGDLAGYVEVWTNQTPPVHPFVWGIVMPEFQGQGIGTHLLAWAESHARTALERVDEDIRVAPVAGAPMQVSTAKALLEDNGWNHIRSYYTMSIAFDGPLPGPEFPTGLSLRTFTADDAADTFRALDESFTDHFGHVEQPFESGFERFKHNLEDPLFDESLWFLATEGEQIAGICLCRTKAPDDPDSGYVWILGVRRPWRKRGLGLALLRHAFGEFHRRSYGRVSLGVDASNITGALRLYEKAGMQVIRQFDLYEKELRPGRELRVHGLEE